MNKILITLAALFSIGTAHAYTGYLKNNTDKSVKIDLIYHGESGFACRPDTRELTKGSATEVSTGLCCLRSATVEVISGDYKGQKTTKTGFRCGDFTISPTIGPIFEIQ